MKRFCCPKCGNDVAEEVVIDAVISNEVMGVEEDGYDDIEYGSCGEAYGGCVSRYQCKRCGFVIPDVKCTEEMREYILKYGK